MSKSGSFSFSGRARAERPLTHLHVNNSGKYSSGRTRHALKSLQFLRGCAAPSHMGFRTDPGTTKTTTPESESTKSATAAAVLPVAAAVEMTRVRMERARKAQRQIGARMTAVRKNLRTRVRPNEMSERLADRREADGEFQHGV